MKPSLLVLIAAVCFLGQQGASASALSRPVTEVLEQIAKISGRVPSKAAEEALETAFKVEGEVALKAARSGGLDLVEAAARHGDEIYMAAKRVPEAIPALSSNADILIPLAGRYGDDVLRLESRIPGMATTAAEAFPDKGLLARLNSLPSDQAKKVIQYSVHASQPGAPKALLEAVEKNGSSILERLSPAQIRNIGLSLAMITTASAAPIATSAAPIAASAAPIAAAGAPEAMAKAIGGPLGWGLAVSMVLGFFALFALGYFGCRRIFRFKRRGTKA